MKASKARCIFLTAPALLVALALVSAAYGQATYLGQVLSANTYGAGLELGVAINSSGTIALADVSHNRILRISPTGQVTTALQGGGSPWIQGGGQGQFQAVTIDDAGNIYAAQTNTLFKIAPNNSVTTSSLGIMNQIDDYCSQFTYAVPLAECEWDAIPTGMAVDPSGNVYVTSKEAGQVVKVPAGGGSPYFVDTSGYDLNPISLVCDRKGTLYIDNATYDDILVVTSDGNVSYMQPPGLNLAGDPVGPFGLPEHALIAIGVDLEGNIYVGSAQFGEQRNALYRISPDGQSYFQMPTSGSGAIAIGATDANDNLVYVDANSNVVRYGLQHADFGSVPVGATSSPVTMQFLMGSGSSLSTISLYSQGYNPNAVGSNLAEFGTTAAMSCSGSPVICSVPVTFTPSAPGPRGGYAVPYNIVSSGGSTVPFRMARIPVEGMGVGANPVMDSAAFTATPLQISSSVIGTPTQSVTDGAGYTYVAVPAANEIIAVAPGGATTAVNTGSYTLSKPQGVALNGAGDLFIADTGNNRILVVNSITEVERNTLFAIESTTGVLSAPGITLDNPTALATDTLGNLYVANTGNNEIDEISFAGLYLEINQGTGSVLVPNVQQPEGVAVDGSGNVVFTNGFDVDERSAATGAITQILTTPDVDAPIGLAVDAGGTVYAADFYEGVVERHTDGTVTREGVYAAQGVSVSPLGVITVVGPGTPAGFTGTVIFQITRTAPSLTFANTTIGFTSSDSPETVTVSNAGNQPVTFTDLSYPTDFPESGSGIGACTVSSSLGAGQSCQLPISFTPQSAATLTEAVTFTSNTLTSTSAQQSISVTGVSNNGGLSQTIGLLNRNQQVAPICCGAYPSSSGFYVNNSASLPVTVTVLSGPMRFNGSLTTIVDTSAGGNRLVLPTSVGAGSGTIMATQGGNATYGPATPVQLTYTVNPASISIRQFTPTPSGTQVYGSSVQALTYLLQGVLAQDQVHLVVTSGVSPASPVGSYTVTVALAGPSAPNYTLSSPTTMPLTVTPAPLSVEAVDAYQLVGATPGPFTWTLAGLQNGDTASVVSGSPTLSTTATSSSPAGAYDITVGGGTLSATNYTFPNLVSGKLNIFAPISLGYGNVAATSTQSFTFPAGMAPLAADIVMLTNGARTSTFGSSPLQCTPGTPGSCTATLDFIPGTPGLWTGALQLYNAGTQSTPLVSIPISGTGLAPQIAFSGGAQTVVPNSNMLGLAGLAFDGAGNMYIPVYNPNDDSAAVYKLHPGGTLTPIGTGWNRPVSIAVDGAGNVYVADIGLNAVVKITPAGVQSTVPFSFASNPQALAFDANGNIYASEGGATICKTTPSGTESTFYPATMTGGYYPSVSSMAFSPTGQLYFADAVHGVIFTVPQGGPPTPVSSAIPGLQSIAFDAAGNLYASSTASGEMGLYELTPTGTVTQLISVSDNEIPSSVALDPSGNLYLVNSGNGGAPAGQILKLDRADAPAVTFPTPTVAPVADTTDGTRTINVQDIGNQPLQVSGLTYPADFPEASGVASDCTASTSLASASSCTLSIDFRPLSTSVTGTSTALSESLALTDNALNSVNVVQSISTSGTVLAVPAPKTSFHPTSITYQARLIGTSSASLTTTLTNMGTDVLQIASVALAGTDAGDFSMTNGCGPSLAINASCTVGVVFKPTASGKRTASIWFTDNSGGVTGTQQAVSLTGTGLTGAANPTFSPTGGTYATAQSVTISSTTSGATFYYTTDGTWPTTSSKLYSGPITVSKNTTIKAITVAGGYANSPMAASVYSIRAAGPTFNSKGGTYSTAQLVTLSSTTPGVSIYYTTDRSTPTTSSTLYTAPVVISKNTMLKAIAVATGYANSPLTWSAYTIRAAAPKYSPAGGTYTTAQSVKLSSTTPGAKFYYTTDGTWPTTSSKLYSGPITVSKNTTIKAITIASGYGESLVASGAYTIRAAGPTFNSKGGTYSTAQLVTLNSTTPGVSIHYTTDRSTPTTSSTLYTAPVVISKNTMLKAIAVATGYANSPLTWSAYTIRAAAPKYSPAGGTYTTAQSVTLSSTTPGATFYYTTDGTWPTTSSTLYSGPITVSKNTTIKAITIASGYGESLVASGAYTIP